MKRITTILTLVSLTAMLCASVDFWPKTTLVELGTDMTAEGNMDAYAGMEIVGEDFYRNDLSMVTYFNGTYGGEDITAMLNLIGVTEYPTAIFDRGAAVSGGGEIVADGSLYLEQLDAVYWDASPVEVSLASFNQATGAWTVDFTMHDPDLLLINTPVYVALIEDNVDDYANHVARAIDSRTLTIGVQGSTESLSGTFDVTGYDGDYLRLLAIICNEQGEYLNSAHSQMGGAIADLQPAIPFDRDVVGPSWADNGNYNYDGDYFSVVNYGPDADFEIDLVGYDLPDGMSVMYCYEDSQGGAGCFNPAAGPFAFSLVQGDWIMFHLLLPQVTQACYFSYEFTVGSTTDRPDPLVIPFTYRTEDMVDVDEDGVPALASLAQNYPNPFNPTTTIAFSLTQPGDVQLTVYDIRGRKVRTLLREACEAGDHQAVWDGRNDSGDTVSSGVYFYRLEANGENNTRRMLLMK